MDKYAHYSREDLISEIERLKKEQVENDSISNSNKMMVNMIVLRRTISDVLSLLLSTNDEVVIDKALLHILHFFDVERVYIGIFDEQSSIVDFTHEVTSEGIISMREDLLRQLSKDDIPWWIDQIKAGKDIIIYDTAKMPPGCGSRATSAGTSRRPLTPGPPSFERRKSVRVYRFGLRQEVFKLECP